MFQPRTKLEQFEDILIESQLLEATLAGGGSPDLGQIASAADCFMTSANPESIALSGLPTGPGVYPGFGIEGVDFDTSDAIFSDRRGSADSVSLNSHKQVKRKTGSFASNKSQISPPTKGKFGFGTFPAVFIVLLHHLDFNTVYLQTFYITISR